MSETMQSRGLPFRSQAACVRQFPNAGDNNGRSKMSGLFRLALGCIAITLFGSSEVLAQAQPISPSFAHCVSYLMTKGAFYGDQTNQKWIDQNAAWLCDGSQDNATPPQAVACFSAALPQAGSWQNAITACRQQRGFHRR